MGVVVFGRLCPWSLFLVAVAALVPSSASTLNAATYTQVPCSLSSVPYLAICNVPRQSSMLIDLLSPPSIPHSEPCVYL